MIKVKITKLDNGREFPLPKYETVMSAGVDLRAAIDEDIKIASGDRTLIPTGIAIGLPIGYEAQIRPRSGLALKHGITMLNAPGTIDADYRGEIKVIVYNAGKETFTVTRGMRIAQMVIAPVTQVTWDEVTLLDDTDRGGKGFGSTGV